MQYKYMQVQTVHKFYSGAMMIVQYTLIVWEHDMGLIGKKKSFYSPVFRPVHSIADELQFKQRQHIVQMPAGGGSASLFSGHHHFLWCTDSQSPLEGVPSHGITSRHL